MACEARAPSPPEGSTWNIAEFWLPLSQQPHSIVALGLLHHLVSEGNSVSDQGPLIPALSPKQGEGVRRLNLFRDDPEDGPGLRPISSGFHTCPGRFLGGRARPSPSGWSGL